MHHLHTMKIQETVTSKRKLTDIIVKRLGKRMILMSKWFNFISHMTTNFYTVSVKRFTQFNKKVMQCKNKKALCSSCCLLLANLNIALKTQLNIYLYMSIFLFIIC